MSKKEISFCIICFCAGFAFQLGCVEDKDSQGLHDEDSVPSDNEQKDSDSNPSHPVDSDCNSGECDRDTTGPIPSTCGDGFCDSSERCEDCALDCGECQGDQLQLPVRAAFYYPWFPETWTVGDGAHVFYQPDLGYYNSDSQSVVDRHIECMNYAKLDVGIISWWGAETHNENVRVPLLFERTVDLKSKLKWAIYYEKEGFDQEKDVTLENIKSDLAYLMDHYVNHETYAHIGGKPVIFVYNADDDDCIVADRWAEATQGEWHVVLKIVSGFEECQNQPDTWHQYGPASAAISHPGLYYAISPGFYKASESTPRLARDIDRWNENIRDMIASNEDWQLITTINEWGEGTAIEPAAEWSSPSGFGQYLDALHSDGEEKPTTHSDNVNEAGEENNEEEEDLVESQEFFTIGFMPDTQYLVNDNGDCKRAGLRGMFEYFIEKENQLNLELVGHVGDMTQGLAGDLHPEEWDGVRDHWERFMTAYSFLEDAHIPFAPARGNHDQRDYFAEYFPVDSYQNEPFFGGYREQLYNAYYLISAAGQDYIVLVVDYHVGTYPDSLVQWANDILREHKNRNAIVVTHDHRRILDSIVKANDNVIMAIMGHSSKDVHWTQKSVGGRIQHIFVFDYQDAGENDCEGAIVKYCTFIPAENTVRMRTYNVHQNIELTNSDCYGNPSSGGHLCQQYDFPVDAP